MPANSLCCIILVTLFVCETLGQVEWSSSNYPNPQEKPDKCGRLFRKKSWVCDPNHVISRQHGDNLDFLLEGLAKNDTRCPCSAWTCEQDNMGFRVAVALVKKIRRSSNAVNTEEALINDAKQFVFDLEDRVWNFGNCEEDVVIFFSEEDRVLYTMTGLSASWYLPGNVIEEISRDVASYFEPGGNVGDGLVEMVLRYRSALRRNYYYRGPTYAALTGNSMSAMVSMTLGHMLLFVMATLVL